MSGRLVDMDGNGLAGQWLTATPVSPPERTALAQTAAAQRGGKGNGGQGGGAAVGIEAINLMNQQNGDVLAEISGGGFLGGNSLSVTLDDGTVLLFVQCIYALK